jgi:hypothetical protein
VDLPSGAMPWIVASEAPPVPEPADILHVPKLALA